MLAEALKLKRKRPGQLRPGRIVAKTGIAGFRRAQTQWRFQAAARGQARYAVFRSGDWRRNRGGGKGMEF